MVFVLARVLRLVSLSFTTRLFRTISVLTGLTVVMGIIFARFSNTMCVLVLVMAILAKITVWVWVSELYQYRKDLSFPVHTCLGLFVQEGRHLFDHKCVPGTIVLVVHMSRSCTPLVHWNLPIIGWWWLSLGDDQEWWPSSTYQQLRVSGCIN